MRSRRIFSSELAHRERSDLHPTIPFLAYSANACACKGHLPHVEWIALLKCTIQYIYYAKLCNIVVIYLFLYFSHWFKIQGLSKLTQKLKNTFVFFYSLINDRNLLFYQWQGFKFLLGWNCFQFLLYFISHWKHYLQLIAHTRTKQQRSYFLHAMTHQNKIQINACLFSLHIVFVNISVYCNVRVCTFFCDVMVFFNPE